MWLNGTEVSASILCALTGWDAYQPTCESGPAQGFSLLFGCFFQMLLRAGQALSFCKASWGNSDCNRCIVNEPKLNYIAPYCIYNMLLCPISGRCVCIKNNVTVLIRLLLWLSDLRGVQTLSLPDRRQPQTEKVEQGGTKTAIVKHPFLSSSTRNH